MVHSRESWRRYGTSWPKSSSASHASSMGLVRTPRRSSSLRGREQRHALVDEIRATSSLRFFTRARYEEISDDYAWPPCLTTDACQDAKLFIPETYDDIPHAVAATGEPHPTRKASACVKRNESKKCRPAGEPKLQRDSNIDRKPLHHRSYRFWVGHRSAARVKPHRGFVRCR